MAPIAAVAADAAALLRRVRSYAPVHAQSLSRRLPSISALNSVANALANPITKRQEIGVIPTAYKVDGPGSGAVVGIVLGSIAGFILIIWLLYAVSGQGGIGGSIVDEEIVIARRDRDRSPRRRSRRSSHIHEIREVSRSPRPARIIVEERVRGTSIGPRPRSRSVLVEERRRVDGDDIVEVIEEGSSIEPPRRHRRRSSGGYSSGRRY